MRRALAALLTLAVPGSVAVLAVAHAAAIPPSITLSPPCGPVGAPVTVSGQNWIPGQTPGYNNPIVITFDPNSASPYVVNVPPSAIDSNGSFSARLVVPNRPLRTTPYPVQVAQYVVVAPNTTPPAGQKPEITQTANFQLPCVTFFVDPDCGSVGGSVTVRGTGWRPDVVVTLAFTPPAGGNPDATVTPNRDTTFAANITVPQRPPGNYVIVASQVSPPGAVALPPLVRRAEFQIPCVKPVIKLLPNVGPPGTVTIVTGTGFPVGAVVKLTWSQGIPTSIPSITVPATQSFQVTLLIYPHDQLGLRQMRAAPDLTVTSAPLFNIATVDFLVVPGTEQPRDFSWRH